MLYDEIQDACAQFMHYSSSNITEKYTFTKRRPCPQWFCPSLHHQESLLHAIVTAVAYILTNNFLLWNLDFLALKWLSNIWTLVISLWSLSPAKDRLPQTNFYKRSQHRYFGTASHTRGNSQTKQKGKKREGKNPVMLVTKHTAACHHFLDCQVIFTTVN